MNPGPCFNEWMQNCLEFEARTRDLKGLASRQLRLPFYLEAMIAKESLGIQLLRRAIEISR